ncbi:MAG: phosphoenolpyruvate synthase, partial [bacterium]
MAKTYVRSFDSISVDDVNIAGGKNASLGEMIRKLKKKEVAVPDGFAATAEAYRMFIKHNNLREKIQKDIEAYKNGEKTLSTAGKSIRAMILKGSFPEEISLQIKEHYEKLSRKYSNKNTDVAVRSSATAEDLPDASFAGQQDTFLNIKGAENVIQACRKCYASLFTDRAISYREEKGFDHMKIALSAGVQKMVRSDKAGSGVMFSIDTDTGFEKVVLINAAWGLGENVVQGAVTPDEYRVFKPLLGKKGINPIIEKSKGAKKKKMIYTTGSAGTTKNISTSEKERNSFVLEDREILKLAEWAKIIEKYYKKPMDMEWAKDGKTGKLYIVQARPETVQSRKKGSLLKTYTLKEKGKVLVKGTAIGDSIASGAAQIIKSAKDIGNFKKGNILITDMTDPDWVPIMKKAAAIVTEKGGRTSHAAIVSRELGIPAVIGTGNAMSAVKNKNDITVSCAQGDTGAVFRGKLDFTEKEIDYKKIPKTKTRVMMNIASPHAAFRWWRLPADGIGLARMEFIINNVIRIHPMALVQPQKVKDKNVRKEINSLTKGYKDKKKYFTDNLAKGIATIAASVFPKPVIVRMSDFKTNEYAN